jgi:uncharacterized protein with GYD domain
MASYLMLFRFTPQGITHLKGSLARVEAAKHMFRRWARRSKPSTG